MILGKLICFPSNSIASTWTYSICITLFCTFRYRYCTTITWNIKQRFCFSFCKLRYNFVEFNSWKKSPIFDRLKGRNKSDQVWNGWRCRCRCHCPLLQLPNDTKENENVIKTIGLISTCITLLRTFLCRYCTTTTWKCLTSLFTEDVNKRCQNFFSFWTWIWFFGIQILESQSVRWNNRDEDWKNANSLFKQRCAVDAVFGS